MQYIIEGSIPIKLFHHNNNEQIQTQTLQQTPTQIPSTITSLSNSLKSSATKYPFVSTLSSDHLSITNSINSLSSASPNPSTNSIPTIPPPLKNPIQGQTALHPQILKLTSATHTNIGHNISDKNALIQVKVNHHHQTVHNLWMILFLLP